MDFHLLPIQKTIIFPGEGGRSQTRRAGGWEGSAAAEAEGLGRDPTPETRRGHQGGAEPRVRRADSLRK